MRGIIRKLARRGPRTPPEPCQLCGAAGYPLGSDRCCSDRYGCGIRQVLHLVALGIIEAPRPPASMRTDDGRPRPSDGPSETWSARVQDWAHRFDARFGSSAPSRPTRPQ